MAYEKVGWVDHPLKLTSVSAENLGKMDNGIAENDKNIGDISKISDIANGTCAGAIVELNNNLARCYRLDFPTRIPDGTDMDTLIDYGSYYCGNAAHAATLTNGPVTNSGFSYRFERINGSLVPEDSTPDGMARAVTTSGIEYKRKLTSGVWGKWYTDMPYENASEDVIEDGAESRNTDCNDYLATTFPFIRLAWISGITDNSPFEAMYDNSSSVTGLYEDFESRTGLLVAFRNVQMVFATTELAIYTRMYKNSAWSDWHAFNGSKYNDSGWIDVAGQLSMSSLFANYSSGQALKIRRNGNVVSIRGGLLVSETIPASQSATEIFTIPIGFRPSAIVNSINTGSGMNRFVLSVNPSTGIVGVARYGTTTMIDIPEGAYLKCDLTFLID